MGKAKNGELGIKGVNDTEKKAKRVLFPNNESIHSIQVGDHHVLAMTFDGKVYAWGDNKDGQVGAESQ